MARSGDWDGDLAMLDELERNQKASPILLASRMTILKAAGRGQEVASVRRNTVDAAWDDADWLNSIAWSIAIGKEDRDLELALKAANRAAELTENKNGEILDTVARVH